MMRRRHFLALAASALAMPLARAQRKVHRIGYLSVRPRLVDQDESFVEGLRKLGYVEGRNISIEWRFFKGDAQSLSDLAAQLAAAKVDCIVTVGISAARAAKSATSTVPIVMANASDDPVRHGLVAALARPGGNVTGFIDISPDLIGKRLQVLKSLVPGFSLVAVLWDPSTPVGTAEYRGASKAAPALGIKLLSLPARNAADIEAGFRGLAASGAQALYVASFGGMLHSQRGRVVDMAARSRLPAIYTLPDWATAGGLVSYAADVNDQHRRAAAYVDRILRGSKPADLPVQQPTKFELIVNLKTAAAIGLSIPPALLAQADKILQ